MKWHQTVLNTPTVTHLTAQASNQQIDQLRALSALSKLQMSKLEKYFLSGCVRKWRLRVIIRADKKANGKIGACGDTKVKQP